MLLYAIYFSLRVKFPEWDFGRVLAGLPMHTQPREAVPLRRLKSITTGTISVRIRHPF